MRLVLWTGLCTVAVAFTTPIDIHYHGRHCASSVALCSSASEVQEETFHRQLLAARLAMKQHKTTASNRNPQSETQTPAPVVADVGPKPTPKTKQTLPERDFVKEERVLRDLLAYRLTVENKVHRTQPVVVKDVGPKPTPKMKPILAERDFVKEEKRLRDLLVYRLTLESEIRKKQPVVMKNVGPKPTPKTKPILPKRDRIREEKLARALLATRMSLEIVERQRRKEKAARLAVDEAQRRDDLARLQAQEYRQRTLLEARLSAQLAAWKEKQSETKATEALRLARQQPKAPEQEEHLTTKYGAIDCLEEKAFTILKDLGMVEATSL